MARIGRPPGTSRAPGAGLQARLDEYARLRDAGSGTWEARDLQGLTDRQRERYERWYRNVRGLPRRERRIPPQ